MRSEEDRELTKERAKKGWWQFSFKEGVFGHVTSLEGNGRWITWDAPWTEDVKWYGCPTGIAYFGKRLSIQWRPFSGFASRYDWKKNYYVDNPGRLSIAPRDHQKRFVERYGPSARVKVDSEGNRKIVYDRI